MLIRESRRTMEGSFDIRRGFPLFQGNHFDPFLLLDYFGPQKINNDDSEGVSTHPHRGFETVTYLIKGGVRHRDSKGNHGLIEPYGVQWMTAGFGLNHSEFGVKEFGGTLQGVQLWVNLPSELKMVEPRYQEKQSNDLPLIEKEDYSVRIISGEYDNQKSPILNYTPVTYLHLSLKPNKEFIWKPDQNWTNLIFSLQSEGTINGLNLKEAELGVLEEADKNIILKNETDQMLEAILLSGKPIKEPIVAYGPFVMNSVGEIKQAIIDYQEELF
jgi:redox-sensitive bicupin YhaK (pirin superfamily)